MRRLRPRKNEEMVPASPFRDWLEARLGSGITTDALADEIGWGKSGAKRLYRYRRGLGEGMRKGARVVLQVDEYSRAVVEDALTHAGGPDLFYQVYPEYAHERAGLPDPETWCPGCQEHVLVVDGECAWCSWRLERPVELVA